MKVETGNGRAALKDRRDRIERGEDSCRALSDHTPSVPDMSHCPNRKESRPWYEWNTKASKTSLDVLAELAACRKDELDAVLKSYDTKHGIDAEEDSCSQFQIGKLINWKIHGKSATQFFTSCMIGLCIIMLLGYIALKSGKIDFTTTHAAALAKANVAMNSEMLEQIGATVPTNVESVIKSIKQEK
jgi:hypothetical protein